MILYFLYVFFLCGYQVLFRFLMFKSGSELKGVNVSKYFGNFDDSNFLGFFNIYGIQEVSANHKIASSCV